MFYQTKTFQIIAQVIMLCTMISHDIIHDHTNKQQPHHSARYLLTTQSSNINLNSELQKITAKYQKYLNLATHATKTKTQIESNIRALTVKSYINQLELTISHDIVRQKKTYPQLNNNANDHQNMMTLANFNAMGLSYFFECMTQVNGQEHRTELEFFKDTDPEAPIGQIFGISGNGYLKELYVSQNEADPVMLLAPEAVGNPSGHWQITFYAKYGGSDHGPAGPGADSEKPARHFVLTDTSDKYSESALKAFCRQFLGREVTVQLPIMKNINSEIMDQTSQTAGNDGPNRADSAEYYNDGGMNVQAKSFDSVMADFHPRMVPLRKENGETETSTSSVGPHGVISPDSQISFGDVGAHGPSQVKPKKSFTFRKRWPWFGASQTSGSNPPGITKSHSRPLSFSKMIGSFRGHK